MTPAMNVRLTVTEKEGGGIIAELVFDNNGSGDVPLYIPNVPVGEEIDNDIFVITSGDVRASYTGAYVKRSAPTTDDFILVPAGQERRFAADLTSAYDIPASSGQRRCRYEAYHGDMDLFGRIFELRSNEVTF